MFKKFTTSVRQRWIAPLLIVVALLGFAAGVVGELFARHFILSYAIADQQLADLNNSFYQLLSQYQFISDTDADQPFEIVIRRSDQSASLQTASQVVAGSVLNNIRQGTVGFFAAAKTATDDPLASSYAADNQIGRGTVLTRDGWIVTTAGVSLVPARSIAVTADGRQFVVEAVVEDTMAGVQFVKIAADNLPVVRLVRDAATTVGQTVAVLNRDGSLETTAVADVLYRPTALQQNIYSTESLDDYYRLVSQLDQTVVGEPVITPGGEVVGLVTVTAGERVVIPAQWFARQFSQASAAGEIIRSTFGVDYLMLDQLVTVPGEEYAYQQQRFGALVYQNARLGTGLLPTGTAAQAGLAAGDVITRVESDEVRGAATLTNLLQTYDIGKTVSLTVWRDGEELQLSLPITAQ